MLLLETKYSSLLIILVFVLIGVLTAIRRPYFRFGHNIRFLCNLLICISIQTIYFCYGLSEQKSHKVWLIMPIVVCALLVICFVYNSVYLVYDIIRRENSNFEKNPETNKMEKLANNTLVTENDINEEQKPNENQNQGKDKDKVDKNNPNENTLPTVLQRNNMKVSE